jgi:hypothetical protein
MRGAEFTMTVTDQPAHERRRTWPVIAAGFGWLLVLLALADLGHEVLLAFRTGSYGMISIGEIWFNLDVASLNLVQAVIQRYVSPALWDPVLVSVLSWPAWSLLGGPGAALVLLFSGRRS